MKIRFSSIVFGVVLLSQVASGTGAEDPKSPSLTLCEQIVAEGADAAVLALSGQDAIESQQIFEFEGHSYSIAVVPEIEARLTFLDSKKSNSSLASELLSRFYPVMVDSVKVRTLGQAMFWHEKWDGAVYLAPLSSQFEHFHESGISDLKNDRSVKLREWNLKPEVNDQRVSFLPNEILYGESYNINDSAFASDRPFGRGHSRDYINVAHWVGWQSETALYYDLLGSDLQEKGWAVRIKMWSPKSKAVSNQLAVPSLDMRANVIRMALTIKKSLGEAYGMTSRQEYHIDLPQDFDLAMASEFIKAAFSKIAPGLVAPNSQFFAKKRVDTDRIGLNIMRASGEGHAAEKIGFLTVDQFVRYVIAQGDFVPRHEGDSLQIEAEVLPEFHDQLAQVGVGSLESHLSQLLKQIELAFHGRPDPNPKFITPNVRREK